MSTRWNLTDDEAKTEISKLVYVMAGVNSADKLAKIQDILGDVARGGTGGMTWAAAEKKLTAMLESDLGGDSKARAELALRTVIFRAKATQKYRTLMKQRAIFPWWEYRSRDDGRVRGAHEALNGKVFPAGHPIWQRIFPPWGWGCRCIVLPRRAHEVEKMMVEDEKKDVSDQRVWEDELASTIYKGERLPGGQSLTTEDVYRSPAESGMELWTEEELKERYKDHPVIQKRFNLYMGEMPEKLKALDTKEPEKKVSKTEKIREEIRTAKYKTEQNLGGGVNTTAILRNGVDVVFKPQSGEYGTYLRAGVTPGDQYLREIAASIVDEYLGTNLVPPVAEVTWKGEVGSAMIFKAGMNVGGIYPQNAGTRKLFKAEVLERWQLLDDVIGHLDRHGGNWMTDQNELVLIDNGLAFSTEETMGGLWTRFAGPLDQKPLTQRAVKRLKKFQQARQEVDKKLKDLLPAKAIKLMWERVETMLHNNKHGL